jgi:flagellar biosynthesis GTPase FlhF
MDHDHANDRRKVQNRQAQRNFRDKRAQKVDDLQTALRDTKAELQQERQDNANTFHAQQARINKLVIEKRASEDNAAFWERKYEEERKLRLATERDNANLRELQSQSGELHSRYVSKQLGFPNSIVQTAGRSMALPPTSNTMNTGMHHDHVNQDPDPYAEHEIDINAEWSKGAFNKGPKTTNGQVDWTGSSMDIDKAMGGNCGFCNIDSGSGPCPCREEAVSSEPKPTLAPGGCDACIADPERAARCKALADRAEVSQRPDTRHDSIPQQTGYMSCSKLFDSTNLPLPSISELFRGDFHAYPSRNSTAGFDVNEHEVARVLQNLRNNGSAGGDLPA